MKGALAIASIATLATKSLAQINYYGPDSLAPASATSSSAVPDAPYVTSSSAGPDTPYVTTSSGVSSSALAADAQAAYSPTVNSAGLPSVSPSSTGPVTVTTTLDECPTDSADPGMVTVTDGVTVTWCPECEHKGTTTVYTTTYLALCTSDKPYSLTQHTYTVTESCDGDMGSYTRSAGYIPQDFTVTTEQCDMCATPGPVTITEPCGCKATNGVPVAASATATPTGSPGAANHRASQAGGKYGPSMPYSGVPTSAPSTYPKGANWGNTTNIAPYTDAAASVHTSGLVALAAIAIGALAFML